MDDPLSTIAAVLGKLEERTAAMQEDVGEIKDEFRAHVEPNDSVHAVVEKRIGALEKAWLMIKGGAAVLLFMAPLFVLGIRDSIAELFK
jgi:hypothetical protein